MRQYAVEYRPKIIILENVSNAPWLKLKEGQKFGKGGNAWTIERHMQAAGYAVRFVRLDTKNYYLPHTRQRGYMVCIDKVAACKAFCGVDMALLVERDKDGKDYCKLPDPYDKVVEGKLEDILEAWATLVVNLERPASVDVAQMLLEDDDPRVLALEGLGNDDQNKKAVAWERCKNGHSDYRAILGLGSKRILTRWVNGGSHTFPDWFQHGTKRMVERTCDTLDIAHVRNALRGFDDRYYK